MAINVKTFRIHDKASEEELNSFLENKVVRHWSTTYSALPTSVGADGASSTGLWDVFIAYEPREERQARAASAGDDRANGRQAERRDGRTDTRQPRNATPAQPKVREPRPDRQPEHVVTLPEAEMPLFEAIRKWRNARAREENVKPFTLFNNRQLEELVKLKPQTMPILKETVPEMRGDLFEKYGNELMGFIGGATSSSDATA